MKEKFRQFYTGLRQTSAVRDLLLAAVAISAIVAYAAISAFTPVGFFEVDSYFVTGNAIETNLTGGRGDSVPLVEAEGTQTLYTRWNTLYTGEEKKTKINTDYPVYVADGAAIRFLDASAVLYNERFARESSYSGLIINTEKAFNTDGSSAGVYRYPFVGLANGLFISSGELELETPTDLTAVPVNSVCLIRPDRFEYYAYRDGIMVRGAGIEKPEKEMTARVDGEEMSYEALLKALGIDVPGEDGKEDDPVSEETEKATEEEETLAVSEEESEGEETKTAGDRSVQEHFQQKEVGEDGDDEPEGAAEGSLEGLVEDTGIVSSSGSSGGKSSSSGRDKGSKGSSDAGKSSTKESKEGSGEETGVEETAEKPEDVEKPSDAKPPETVPQTKPVTPAPPEKGKKKPQGPSPYPSGSKENLDWKEPSVLPGNTFVPGIYSLKTNVLIDDPAGVIVSGVSYSVTIMNEYGKYEKYKSVVVQANGEPDQVVLIAGLKPDSAYRISGSFLYRDRYGSIQNREFLPEKEFHTKPLSEIGPLRLEDLELGSAERLSDCITVPNLRFTEDSDQDAIGSLTQVYLILDAGTKEAVGSQLSAVNTEKMRSYQKVSFTSKKELKSNHQYKLSIYCYDRFYNELKVEDPEGKNEWQVFTCLARPQAEITVKNNKDSQGNYNTTVDITAKITNPDRIDYTDLKLRISDAEGSWVKLNGDQEYLSITPGETVTVANLGSREAFTAKVSCVCDIGDRFGRVEREIGSQRFVTSNLADLGPVYLTTENISSEVIEREAALLTREKERDTKLAEKSSRVVLKFSLDKEKTNPGLYDPGLGLVDVLTFRLTAATATGGNYQVTLTDEELSALLAGGMITLDTADTSHFPNIPYQKLSSNTTYSLSFEGTCIYDLEKGRKESIKVKSSLARVKTAMHPVEVELDETSVTFFEGFIYMDLRLKDIDGVISGETAVLQITDAATGKNVGAFRITKNLDAWTTIRLSSDASTSTGGVSYEIKADTVYKCSFMAEEAYPDGNYRTWYVFKEFERSTGQSLTGSLYSLGLQERDSEHFDAPIAYELNVPEDDSVSEAVRSGSVYIEEWKRDGQGGAVSQKVVPVSYGLEGLHPEVTYVTVQEGTGISFTEAELEEKLKTGEIRKFAIDDRYALMEYTRTTSYSYLDTGYIGSSTTGFYADIMGLNTTTTFNAAFGASGNTSWTNNAIGISMRAGDIGFQWKDKNTTFVTASTVNVRHVFERKANLLYMDGTLKYTSPTTAFQGTRPIFLGAINYGGSASSFLQEKVYGFRLYDGEELKREYLPCTDTFTGKAGFYERVSDRFVTSNGTGEFIGSERTGKYYYVDEDGKEYRLMEKYTPKQELFVVDRDSNEKHSYYYELYFIYAKGTPYETKIVLDTTEFTTEEEILTIASGEEFITKGANAKKYVVINDIAYDNRDNAGAVLNTMAANIDFQGFSFETYVNYGAIVNTTTKEAKLRNMVLKTTSGRLTTFFRNDLGWKDGLYGGCFIRSFYGIAQNLYIEFSQEEFPYLYNLRGTGTNYTYWSTKSPEEMAALPSDTERNKYKYRIQSVIASFASGNYGTIENFVVDYQTPVLATEYFGGLVNSNNTGGEIRNGYAFSSANDDPTDLKAKILAAYGYEAYAYTNNIYGNFGGIVGYGNTYSLLENVFALVDIESYTKDDILQNSGGVVGTTQNASAKIRNAYHVGDRYYLEENASTGETVRKSIYPDYGPAVGKIYSGGKVQNIYYLSDEALQTSNAENQKVSPFALRSSVWQEMILNQTGGYLVNGFVDVGYYPQVNYTASMMPAQPKIPIERYDIAGGDRDIALSYAEEDPAANKDMIDDRSAQEKIATYQIGNEAWDAVPAAASYESEDQVACILISETDQERIVYSLNIDGFELTHDDILWQQKDGTGIIKVYVHLHDPKQCLSRYRILSVTYQDNETKQAGETFTFSGTRYLEAEYYKQIRRAAQADGVDSWEAMVKKYAGKTASPENMVLKADIDFTGLTAKQILIQNTYTGKLNGAGFALRNIGYDNNLYKTLSLTNVAREAGLIWTLNGEVRDLTIDHMQLEAGGDTGALCGIMNGAYAERVAVTNSYISGGRLLGGITGLSTGSEMHYCSVTDSKILHNAGGEESATTDTGYDYFTGGIAGYMTSTKLQRSFVQNAYLESMYVDYNTATGGLVGYLPSSSASYIDGCYATGVICCNSDFSGGLIGMSRNALQSFTNCYSDMDIYAYNYNAGRITGYYNGTRTAVPDASLVSFGEIIEAVIYEDGDVRNGNVDHATYDSSISVAKYLNGSLFAGRLSLDYFCDSREEWTKGILPKITDEKGNLIAGQKDEYLGVDDTADGLIEGSMTWSSGSLRMTGSGTQYQLSGFRLHHSTEITIKKLYFGFTYADTLCDMNGKELRFPSFTDSPVLQPSSEAVTTSGGGTVSELKYSGMEIKAAYDKYFITAAEYEEPDGNGGKRTRIQRLGILLPVAQQWKNVSGADEWIEKIYGTHVENFRITGDIDWSGKFVYTDVINNRANTLVNRLVGSVKDGQQDRPATAESDYWKISGLQMNDSSLSLNTAGMWPRRTCRGLVSVVNTELGYLTFENDSVTTVNIRNGMFGALTGHGHHLKLSGVQVTSTANIPRVGFIASLKDGISDVYMENCTLKAGGTYSGFLTGYIHPYTHNNYIKNAKLVNCTGTSALNTTSTVYNGLLTGCSYRSWAVNATPKSAREAMARYENITAENCTMSSTGAGLGIIAGESSGTVKDGLFTDCTVNAGHTYGGILFGSGHCMRIENVTIGSASDPEKKCTVTGVGYLGSLVGSVNTSDGTTTSGDAAYGWIKNCSVFDADVHTKQTTLTDTSCYYIGGLVGFFNQSSTSYGFEGNLVNGGNISCKSSYAGGLSGRTYHVLLKNNTVQNVTLSGTTKLGGLVGASDGNYYTYAFDNTVENCLLKGASYIGGLFGTGSNPYRGNLVKDCVMIGTEYNVAGSTGYQDAWAGTDQTIPFVSNAGGYTGVTVKNCKIYGKYNVAGGSGSMSSVAGCGTPFIDNCEIYGSYNVAGAVGNIGSYGTAGTTSQIYRQAYRPYIRDTLIAEMNDEVALMLKQTYDVAITHLEEKKYFGGIVGKGGTSIIALIENSVIDAPDANYVGAIQGSYQQTYYNDSYKDTRVSVSKNCTVNGRDYVGGIFGEVRGLYNKSFLTASQRIAGEYLYSNAQVTGENHVAGIAGLYTAQQQAENANGFNPLINKVYFTGTLTATGTENGSGIAATVFADQAITHSVYDPSAKKTLSDGFQLNGVISMPEAITGKKVYVLINTDVSDNNALLKEQAGSQFLTVWKGTQITESGVEKDMGSMIEAEYAGYTFAPADFDSVIKSSKRTTDPRFIMVLDSTYDPGDVYSKGLLGESTYFSYNKAFANVAADPDWMPFVKQNTELCFGGQVTVIDGESVAPTQGIHFPGTTKAAAEQEAARQMRTDYEQGKDWNGRGQSVAEKLFSFISITASDIDSINIEFLSGLTEAMTELNMESLSFRTAVAEPDTYLSTLVTEVQASPESIEAGSLPKTYTYRYNFTDSLVLYLDYTQSDGAEGRVSKVIVPENVRKKNTTGAYLREGSVRSFTGGTVLLDKADIAGLTLPSGYTGREYIQATGVQRIDTGVRVRDSETYFSFSADAFVNNMFLFGSSPMNDHELIIELMANGKGFGYLGGSIGTAIDAGLATGDSNRYTIHVLGKTGNLKLDVRKDLGSGAAFTNYYAGTGYNNYVLDGAYNMTFCNRAASGTYSGMKGKIYGAKIYYKDQLVRNFVPCSTVMNTKEVGGLYDLVEGKFYQSAASNLASATNLSAVYSPEQTKDFKYGPEVSAVDVESREYIHLHGAYALDSYGHIRGTDGYEYVRNDSGELERK